MWKHMIYWLKDFMCVLYSDCCQKVLPCMAKKRKEIKSRQLFYELVRMIES